MPNTKHSKRPVTDPFDALREKQNQEWEEKTARLAASLDLVKLGDSERAFLALCQRIYREDRGFPTPFEDFLVSLVQMSAAFSVTPDLAGDRLEEFKEHFEDCRAIAEDFPRRYPESMKPEKDAIQTASSAA